MSLIPLTFAALAASYHPKVNRQVVKTIFTGMNEAFGISCCAGGEDNLKIVAFRK